MFSQFVFIAYKWLGRASEGLQVDLEREFLIEIEPERVLVLFRPRTTLFWFDLGTFFVPELDLAKHFR